MVNYDGLYNKEYHGDLLKQKHFSDKKLSFRIFENCTFLPNKHLNINGKSIHLGGLLDDKLNFIKGTHVNHAIGGRYTPNEEIQFSNETVIFLGTFNPDTWGHFFTDDFQRVWFLQDETYKKYFKDLPLLYLSLNAGGV